MRFDNIYREKCAFYFHNLRSVTVYDVKFFSYYEFFMSDRYCACTTLNKDEKEVRCSQSRRHDTVDKCPLPLQKLWLPILLICSDLVSRLFVLIVTKCNRVPEHDSIH